MTLHRAPLHPPDGPSSPADVAPAARAASQPRDWEFLRRLAFAHALHAHERVRFALGLDDAPVLMGVINATPDSFFAAGRFSDTASAVDAARRLAREGAAILDIGGESTRPGAERVAAEAQLDRVLPVIRALHESPGPLPLISIDTTLATVAAAALDAGAAIINDVSAGLDDHTMLPLAAARDCGLILMHRLRPPERDSYSNRYSSADEPRYDDVVRQVGEFLRARVLAAIDAGVRPEAIVVDPGLGFGKSVQDNARLLAGAADLSRMAFGRPVLSALSRKSFTGALAGMPPDAPPSDRLPATLACSIEHFRRGCRLFRVHDVAAHREALAAARAFLPTRSPCPDPAP